MTTEVRISETFAFPIDVVTETIAILAKRGAGKSYAASVMVEGMIEAALPVVVIDPVGSWWGLRFGADGKSPGLPVFILGGDHADLEIAPTHGRAIADFLVASRHPIVIDLGRFSKGESRRFMLDFCSRIFESNRAPLHVVIDEADAFIPQRFGGEEAPLIGAINDIVRRGRARGLGVTLISQRPALINKDVLTQIEVLIALRMTGPHDRKAIKDWIDTNADEVSSAAALQELPELPIGRAWLWSPGWLSKFERVAIAKRKTFDSSATPKAGIVLELPSTGAAAPVDIEALRTELAAALEVKPAEIEAASPALRARIRELEKKLAEKPTPPPPRPLLGEQDREQIVLLATRITELLKKGDAWLTALNQVLESAGLEQLPLREELKSRPNGARSNRPRTDEDLMSASPELAAAFVAPPRPWIDTTLLPKPQRSAPAVNAGPPLHFETTAPSPKPARVASPSAASNGAALSVGQRKIIDALFVHGTCSRKKLAILSDYAVGGGAFRNLLSALRVAGLIDGGTAGGYGLTAVGRLRVTPGLTALPSNRAGLLDYWTRAGHGIIGRAERLILSELVRVIPNELVKPQLGKMTGYEHDGGAFRNALSKLRTLELIRGSRLIRAGSCFGG